LDPGSGHEEKLGSLGLDRAVGIEPGDFLGNVVIYERHAFVVKSDAV
jgi:hypothetical protein